MTADVLDEGTPSRSALQIAEELEFIGADLNVRSSFDGSFVTLNTLTKHLDKALEVFGDVVVNASFPQKEFDRLKEQRLTSLLQQKDRPATIASIAFHHIVYGEGHPYGNDPSGTESSIKGLTRDELVRFYTTYYRPNNATLIVVGNATLGDITQRMERALGHWAAGTVPGRKTARIPEVTRRSLYLIDKPGAAQSEVRIGYPAVARSSPDFFAITLLNRILGGQFSSRLNMNLREKRGFSYGVRSNFSFTKQPGPFVASGAIVTAKTDSALVEFRHEIEAMQREGVTAAELAFVKKGFSGNFALTFETPAQIAGALQNVVLYDLPENYYATYLQNIDKVTLADVRAAAQKYLDTSRMAFVVVGDLKTIRDGCEKLGLGETIICSVEGKRVTQ
jgi:predicted Zn-dependent peptidase